MSNRPALFLLSLKSKSMFERFTRIIAELSLWVGGICMAIMALVTVADVFMRYVFLSPLPGTGEHTQILLAIIVFSGLVLVTREGTHIVVSLFEDVLNDKLPGLFRRLFWLANVLGLVFILYVMVEAVSDMLEFEEETMVMAYPLVYLGITLVAFVVLSILQLGYLAKHGPSGHGSAD